MGPPGCESLYLGVWDCLVAWSQTSRSGMRTTESSLRGAPEPNSTRAVSSAKPNAQRGGGQEATDGPNYPSCPPRDALRTQNPLKLPAQEYLREHGPCFFFPPSAATTRPKPGGTTMSATQKLAQMNARAERAQTKAPTSAKDTLLADFFPVTSPNRIARTKPTVEAQREMSTRYRKTAVAPAKAEPATEVANKEGPVAKHKQPAASAKAQAKVRSALLNPCLCGCKAKVTGTFKQGHDARLRGMLVRGEVHNPSAAVLAFAKRHGIKRASK